MLNIFDFKLYLTAKFTIFRNHKNKNIKNIGKSKQQEKGRKEEERKKERKKKERKKERTLEKEERRNGK